MSRKKRISESALQVATLALKESFPDLTPDALRKVLERKAKSASEANITGRGIGIVDPKAETPLEGHPSNRKEMKYGLD